MKSEQPSSPEIYDVVIIGGGPAGLSAALYAARGKLSTIVLDKNPAAGALGHAACIENYPGVLEQKTGPELLNQFRRHAEQFGAKVEKTEVIGVDFTKMPREIITGDTVYKGRAVIIATGNMGRTATLPGEGALVGHGVSYCATCDASFFQNRAVAVVGMISRVVDELEIIARFASRIYLLTPQKNVSAEELAVLESIGKIDLLPDSRVAEIRGNHEGVTGLRYTDMDGEHFLEVEGVFIFLQGSRPVVDFLSSQVEVTPRGCIYSDKHNMVTSLEGVFTAGDVTCKDVRQVTVAVGEGCIAALSAEKYINRRDLNPDNRPLDPSGLTAVPPAKGDKDA